MKWLDYLLCTVAALLTIGCSEPERSRDLADARVHGAVIAVQVCANCHGPGGNSVSPNFPALAGQRHEYMVAQLRAFRDKTRSDPQAVAYMWGLTRSLTDGQIEQIAAYYAAQPARPRAAASPTGLSDAGRAIYGRGAANGTPACAVCHGEQAQGTEIAPRLAGQHAAYVERQLHIYMTTNERPGGEAMKLACKGMSAEDVRAVAAFVQSLAATPRS